LILVARPDLIRAMEFAKSYGKTSLAFSPITLPIGVLGTLVMGTYTRSVVRAIGPGFSGAVGFNTYLATSVLIKERGSAWFKRNARRFSLIAGITAAVATGLISLPPNQAWLTVAGITWSLLQFRLFNAYCRMLET